MGTGAVYLTLTDLKAPPMKALTTIETIFYFMTIALFLLNTSTLLLQFICEHPIALFLNHLTNPCHEFVVYPTQAKRLITTPSTGIFVPLMVCLPHINYQCLTAHTG